MKLYQTFGRECGQLLVICVFNYALLPAFLWNPHSLFAAPEERPWEDFGPGLFFYRPGSLTLRILSRSRMARATQKMDLTLNPAIALASFVRRLLVCCSTQHRFGLVARLWVRSGVLTGAGVCKLRPALVF